MWTQVLRAEVMVWIVNRVGQGEGSEFKLLSASFYRIWCKLADNQSKFVFSPSMGSIGDPNYFLSARDMGQYFRMQTTVFGSIEAKKSRRRPNFPIYSDIWAPQVLNRFLSTL